MSESEDFSVRVLPVELLQGLQVCLCLQRERDRWSRLAEGKKDVNKIRLYSSSSTLFIINRLFISFLRG